MEGKCCYCGLIVWGESQPDYIRQYLHHLHTDHSHEEDIDGKIDGLLDSI